MYTISLQFPLTLPFHNDFHTVYRICHRSVKVEYIILWYWQWRLQHLMFVFKSNQMNSVTFRSTAKNYLQCLLMMLYRFERYEFNMHHCGRSQCTFWEYWMYNIYRSFKENAQKNSFAFSFLRKYRYRCIRFMLWHIKHDEIHMHYWGGQQYTFYGFRSE